MSGYGQPPGAPWQSMQPQPPAAGPPPGAYPPTGGMGPPLRPPGPPMPGAPPSMPAPQQPGAPRPPFAASPRPGGPPSGGMPGPPAAGPGSWGSAPPLGAPPPPLAPPSRGGPPPSAGAVSPKPPVGYGGSTTPLYGAPPGAPGPPYGAAAPPLGPPNAGPPGAYPTGPAPPRPPFPGQALPQQPPPLQQQQQQPQPPSGFRPGSGPTSANGYGPPAPPGGMTYGAPPPPGPPGFPPPGAPGMPPPPPGAGGAGLPPGPGGFGGMPPPPGAGGFGGPPPPGSAPDAYHGQRLVEQFEALVLAPGGAGMGPGSAAVEPSDTSSFPRPAGPGRPGAYAPQPPYDRGNCSPDNMRPTVNAIPNSTALRSRWQLPLGIIVCPMADEALGRSVPVIPLGPHGIVRCRRCRTYMNPFCTWSEGGRRFQCNVCGMHNEAPIEYFSTLDAMGRRRDADERPELSTGTVEWVAPTEYMVRPPMPPVYFFCIDISQASLASGLVREACAAIKACLEQLPGEERTLVGFLTFDSSLHFYNLKASLAAPQMMVVTELDEPFLPLPDELLVNLRDSRHLVDALLDSLPSTNAFSADPNSATGPALQASFLVMSHLGGKLLLFQGSPPSLGPGRVKAQRENLALYGTEREPSLRSPEDPFFKRYAAEASRVQITLDAFVAAQSPVDLASLAAIPRYTCGQVYYYPSFHGTRDGAKLAAEVTRNLTRPTAWEAVMRIRCSKGLRISSFHGHFFNRSTDLLALPTCDPDKAFAVQIAHEETVVAGPVAFVQCALLYTNSNGERRIRVHSMVLPVVTDLSEMYRAADAAASAALLSKLGVEKALMARLDETRSALQRKVEAALREYRLLHGAHVRTPGALIYPASLRLLPLLTLGLVKSAAFRGSGRDVAADERAAVMHELMAAPVDDTALLAYPDCYQLLPEAPPGVPAPGTAPPPAWGTPDAEGRVVLPPTAPASLAYLSPSGAYLIDNGRVLVLWLGRSLDGASVAQLLGPDAGVPGADVSSMAVEPARPGSSLGGRLCTLLGALRRRHVVHGQCFAVRQGTPPEAHVVPLFVEDRQHAQMSYADFMVAVHKFVVANK